MFFEHIVQEEACAFLALLVVRALHEQIRDLELQPQIFLYQKCLTALA